MNNFFVVICGSITFAVYAVLYIISELVSENKKWVKITSEVLTILLILVGGMLAIFMDDLDIKTGIATLAYFFVLKEAYDYTVEKYPGWFN